MKIGIIGNFGGNRIGGQVTKTRELYSAMAERYGDINKLDVYNMKGKYFCFIKGVIGVLLHSDSVVIILGDQSYFKVQPMILLINAIFRRRLFDVVIGGIRAQNAQKSKVRLYCEKRMQKIYVETRAMETQCKEIGLENVAYLPNFKNMRILALNEVASTRNKNDVLRLCTFSRIDSTKGIDTAIEVMHELNRPCECAALDIIGPVDEAYKDGFNRIMEDSKAPYIRYAGEIDGNNAVEALKNYDLLLFPTRWVAEGFPGTFLDAMASGLPIISSDNINFREIIQEGYNGYLVKEAEGVDGYVRRLLELRDNPETLLNMKRNSLKEAQKYTTGSVLKQLWDDME